MRIRAILRACMLMVGVLHAEPPTSQPITLQLKWQHQFQFAGYYAAQEKGYYREAGLDVVLKEAIPGLDIVDEVVSGRAQYGVGNCSLLLERQKGRPVVVLAAVFQHSPVILIARAGSGITTVQDLRGKRLMVEKQNDELLAYLRKEGVTESTLRLMPHTFDPLDLTKGRVDCMSAYATDEPFLLLKSGTPFLELTPRMGGIDFYGDNLFTTEAELKANPARVRAFREASMRGWKYAMQHPEEVADLIIARYGERRGREYLLFEAQKMVSLVQPTAVEMGYMYQGRWQHIVDTYADLGMLPRNFRLQGFLYDPEAGARQSYHRLVTALVALLALGGALGGLALMFFRLNLRLRREIASREKAEEGMREEHNKQVALQAQLLQAQKMESLGSLAGGVAHDMNNVLGAILGMASTQIEATPENTPAHRALGTIIKAAERGGRVVRGLLSFARRSPAQEQEVNINDILREEVHLLERTTLAKVALELDLAPDLRAMRGDGSALNYALMNLCVNAVDAMPDQGKLILRTRNLDGDRIEVQVEDNGAGMPPEVLERALDPFFTTKADGKGTGLGLSLVYSTVKAHQGTLDIQSEPGKGTCVRLTFPALAGVPTDDGLQVQSGPLRSAVGLKVLLVDDDELIRSSMESVLEALGHTGILASSGEEALALLERGTTPDLVVLDMNMPGIGGAGTLPRIRARWPRLPVLLATGRADQAAQDLVDAHAVASLLSKPFSIREFQESLEGLARRH